MPCDNDPVQVKFTCRQKGPFKIVNKCSDKHRSTSEENGSYSIPLEVDFSNIPGVGKKNGSGRYSTDSSSSSYNSDSSDDEDEVAVNWGDVINIQASFLVCSKDGKVPYPEGERFKIYSKTDVPFSHKQFEGRTTFNRTSSSYPVTRHGSTTLHVPVPDDYHHDENKPTFYQLVLNFKFDNDKSEINNALSDACLVMNDAFTAPSFVDLDGGASSSMRHAKTVQLKNGSSTDMGIVLQVDWGTCPLINKVITLLFAKEGSNMGGIDINVPTSFLGKDTSNGVEDILLYYSAKPFDASTNGYPNHTSICVNELNADLYGSTNTLFTFLLSSTTKGLVTQYSTDGASVLYDLCIDPPTTFYTGNGKCLVIVPSPDELLASNIATKTGDTLGRIGYMLNESYFARNSSLDADVNIVHPFDILRSNTNGREWVIQEIVSPALYDSASKQVGIEEYKLGDSSLTTISKDYTVLEYATGKLYPNELSLNPEGKNGNTKTISQIRSDPTLLNSASLTVKLPKGASLVDLTKYPENSRVHTSTTSSIQAVFNSTNGNLYYSCPSKPITPSPGINPVIESMEVKNDVELMADGTPSTCMNGEAIIKLYTRNLVPLLNASGMPYVKGDNYQNATVNVISTKRAQRIQNGRPNNSYFSARAGRPLKAGDYAPVTGLKFEKAESKNGVHTLTLKVRIDDLVGAGNNPSTGLTDEEDKLQPGSPNFIDNEVLLKPTITSITSGPRINDVDWNSINSAYIYFGYVSSKVGINQDYRLAVAVAAKDESVSFTLVPKDSTVTTPFTSKRTGVFRHGLSYNEHELEQIKKVVIYYNNQLKDAYTLAVGDRATSGANVVTLENRKFLNDKIGKWYTRVLEYAAALNLDTVPLENKMLPSGVTNNMLTPANLTDTTSYTPDQYTKILNTIKTLIDRILLIVNPYLEVAHKYENAVKPVAKLRVVALPRTSTFSAPISPVEIEISLENLNKIIEDGNVSSGIVQTVPGATYKIKGYFQFNDPQGSSNYGAVSLATADANTSVLHKPTLELSPADKPHLMKDKTQNYFMATLKGVEDTSIKLLLDGWITKYVQYSSVYSDDGSDMNDYELGIAIDKAPGARELKYPTNVGNDLLNNGGSYLIGLKQGAPTMDADGSSYLGTDVASTSMVCRNDPKQVNFLVPVLTPGVRYAVSIKPKTSFKDCCDDPASVNVSQPCVSTIIATGVPSIKGVTLTTMAKYNAVVGLNNGGLPRDVGDYNDLLIVDLDLNGYALSELRTFVIIDGLCDDNIPATMQQIQLEFTPISPPSIGCSNLCIKLNTTDKPELNADGLCDEDHHFYEDSSLMLGSFSSYTPNSINVLATQKIDTSNINAITKIPTQAQALVKFNTVEALKTGKYWTNPNQSIIQGAYVVATFTNGCGKDVNSCHFIQNASMPTMPTMPSGM